MNWDKFKYSDFMKEQFSNTLLTDIECPNCGKPIYMRTDIVLTSYPVQYSYFCKCGWTGTSHMKWNKLFTNCIQLD